MGLRTVAVVIALCLVSVGCGGYNGAVETSTNFLWPEKVELESESELNGAEQKMSRIVYPLDTRLQSLIQAVRTLETERSGNVRLAGLLAEHSWIREAAVVGPKGQVKKHLPEESASSFAISNILREASQWKDRDLHALFGEPRYGADVVMLRALYSGGRHEGYLLVSFDFAALAEHSPRAQELVIVSRENVLWSGGYDSVGEALAETNWDDRLESGATGELRIKDRNFLWVARYIGQEPFFYAVETQQEQ